MRSLELYSSSFCPSCVFDGTFVIFTIAFTLRWWFCFGYHSCHAHLVFLDHQHLQAMYSLVFISPACAVHLDVSSCAAGCAAGCRWPSCRPFVGVRKRFLPHPHAAGLPHGMALLQLLLRGHAHRRALFSSFVPKYHVCRLSSSGRTLLLVLPLWRLAFSGQGLPAFAPTNRHTRTLVICFVTLDVRQPERTRSNAFSNKILNWWFGNQ